MLMLLLQTLDVAASKTDLGTRQIHMADRRLKRPPGRADAIPKQVRLLVSRTLPRDVLATEAAPESVAAALDSAVAVVDSTLGYPRGEVAQFFEHARALVRQVGVHDLDEKVPLERLRLAAELDIALDVEGVRQGAGLSRTRRRAVRQRSGWKRLACEVITPP